jgi:hypothetical protein
MDVEPVQIEGYYEILALHKMLVDRKFDGPEDEYFGSPYIAAVQNRLADALEAADPGSGWCDWRKAEAHTRYVEKVRGFLSTAGDWWRNTSEQERATHVRVLLAPLRPSAGLLDELVNVPVGTTDR